MGTSEQEKKRRRKRRVANNVDLDDDDDGQQDEIDSKQDDNDLDVVTSKSGRRVGKRKIKETTKKFSDDPVPAKLMKQMTTLLDFVIKYRDK